MPTHTRSQKKRKNGFAADVGYFASGFGGGSGLVSGFGCSGANTIERDVLGLVPRRLRRLRVARDRWQQKSAAIGDGDIMSLVSKNSNNGNSTTTTKGGERTTRHGIEEEEDLGWGMGVLGVHVCFTQWKRAGGWRAKCAVRNVNNTVICCCLQNICRIVCGVCPELGVVLQKGIWPITKRNLIRPSEFYHHRSIK